MIVPTSIKMLGLNITFTEEIVQKAIKIAETIIYNEKLNENYLLARVSLYENFKPMLFSPDPDSLAEELKRVHLQFYV